MGARVVLVLFNLIPQTMLRLLSVCNNCIYAIFTILWEFSLTLILAKFTGYQYGGRPLGLTYVKYQNPNGAEAMEGQEETGGLTQDQIM